MMQANIALISPIKPNYSETFVQAHLDLLPFQVHHFYGLPKMGYYPIYGPHGKALFTDFKPILYAEGAVDILTGRKAKGYYFRKKPLQDQFKTNHIQAVLVEYGPTGAYVMEECKATSIPLIVHFHGRDAYLHRNLDVYGQQYKTLFQIASKVIAVSQDMKRQLVSLSCPEHKIHVTPCGPNPELFSFVKTHQNQNQLVAVGRFCDKKAPLNTIKAFELARKKRADLTLLMLGDGPLLQSAKDYCLAHQLDEVVQLPGRVEHKFIQDSMAQSKAFIQHSIRSKDGDSEGMPVSVAEAMLVGLPVISTHHAGIPDVVLHKETGYLTTEGDVEAMAEGILWVFEHEERRASLGKKGHHRITENFSMRHHIAALTDVINEAITSQSSE